MYKIGDRVIFYRTRDQDLKVHIGKCLTIKRTATTEYKNRPHCGVLYSVDEIPDGVWEWEIKLVSHQLMMFEL